MDCPVCRIPLLVVEKLQVELDCCGRCRGVWFDGDEMALLLGEAGVTGADGLMRELLEAETVVAKERDRPCPRCGTGLRKVSLAGSTETLVDLCPAGDGIWLDRGELGRVVDVLGGSTGARARLGGYLGLLGGETKETPRDPGGSPAAAREGGSP